MFLIEIFLSDFKIAQTVRTFSRIIKKIQEIQEGEENLKIHVGLLPMAVALWCTHAINTHSWHCTHVRH